MPALADTCDASPGNLSSFTAWGYSVSHATDRRGTINTVRGEAKAQKTASNQHGRAHDDWRLAACAMALEYGPVTRKQNSAWCDKDLKLTDMTWRILVVTPDTGLSHEDRDHRASSVPKRATARTSSARSAQPWPRHPIAAAPAAHTSRASSIVRPRWRSPRDQSSPRLQRPRTRHSGFGRECQCRSDFGQMRPAGHDPLNT
jgi:hypothetical protein